ncbi:MAG: ATPase involved in chromosome partitioning [uncultured archaeon A07HR67]|nr:MAG: ATPase involved in chromosome partitioning [uncultured archaeon A07HR67]
MIAVAGGKGGSGKTTTTVGLARAFSRRGASVVAADADWDLPNLAALAAETDDPVATHTGATPRSRADSDGCAPAQTAPGSGGEHSTVVDVGRRGRLPSWDRSVPLVLDAPAEPRNVDAEIVLTGLDAAVPAETPLLVDCPAGAAPDAAAPFRAADRCVLVTTLRRPALRDAVKTAAIARRLGCRPLDVVVTRTASTPDALARLLACPVLASVPPAPAAPLADARVAAAYDDAARRLVESYGKDRWRIA